MARTKKDRQSYSAGERGRNRCRVFPDHGTGTMRIEWRENGQRLSESLEHRDWELAKAQADEFAANYVAPRPEAEPETEPLTLGKLFEMYLGRKTPEKSAGVQRFDEAATRRLLGVLGEETTPSGLNEEDWQRFIDERQSGGVGPRTVARDLKFLLAVLNWATGRSDGHGGILLDRNPLKGLPIPSEKNPNRRLLSEADYQSLLSVADEVSPMLLPLLILAHETGHRIGAVRKLQWSDLDLERGSILWRAENDKIDNEHRTPLTEAALTALWDYRRRNPTIRLPFVFPAPRNHSVPISRHLARDWWKRAVALAGLEPKRGRGWHSLRRKFATDLMDRPLAVLKDLGGWKRTETITECYQHPSQERLRQELESRHTGSRSA